MLTYFGNDGHEFSTTNVSVRINLRRLLVAVKRSRMGKNACIKMCTSSNLLQVIGSSVWYKSMLVNGVRRREANLVPKRSILYFIL